MPRKGYSYGSLTGHMSKFIDITYTLSERRATCSGTGGNVRFRAFTFAAASVCFGAWSLSMIGAAAQPAAIPPVVVAAPGETGRRITEDGLLANYFPGQRNGPALLTLGGSVGGLSTPTNELSKALQSQGYGVLHLSLFRAPGQNPRLELIPLEYFEVALAWLRRQPEVDGGRIGIIGVSKGTGGQLAEGPGVSRLELAELGPMSVQSMRAAYRN